MSNEKLNTLVNPTSTITYWKSKNGIGILKHVGYNYLGDFLFQGVLDEKNDYCFHVRKELVHEAYVQVDFNPAEIKIIRCGGVKAYMQDRGDHVACSNCGSAMYDQFIEVLNAVNEGIEGYSVQQAKGYKYYLETPAYKHQKFYTDHIPNYYLIHSEYMKNLNEKIVSACKKSWELFEKRRSVK